MRLKKQYGKQVSAGTPKTVIRVIPQVFHGTSGEITVTAFSVVHELPVITETTQQIIHVETR